jgi:hypothetical protein
VASPTEMKKDEMMMMGADHNMYDLMHHDDKSR